MEKLWRIEELTTEGWTLLDNQAVNLTKDQCDQIIKWTFDNKTFADGKEYSGYQFCELMDYGGSFHNDLSPPALFPIKNVIDTLMELNQLKACQGLIDLVSMKH